MKRFLKALAVTLALTALLAVSAFAADFTHCADTLHDLGLFQGTATGYDLDRAPTRAEAATMLVRLLGKENEAKTLTYSAPFTDVPAWAQPYVQYLYSNGLTTGKTATTFGPADKCTAQQYSTFLLRALGYNEKDGDFTYAKAIDFATQKGVADYINCNQTNFLRDDVAAMSYTALATAPKSGEADLLTKLVKDGAIASDKGYEAKLALYREFLAASAASDKETKSRMTMDMNLNSTLAGKKFMTGTVTMDISADMNLAALDQSKLAATSKVDMTIDPAYLEAGQNGSIKTDMSYYYTNGYYYLSANGVKNKMALSFENVMAQMGSMSSSQAQPVSLLEDISKDTKSDGSVVYTIDYAPAAFSGLTKMASSLTGTSGAQVSFTKMSTAVTVKDGKVAGTDIALGMKMSAEGQTMALDMTAAAKVVATGSAVTVTLPSDLSSYTLLTAEG